MRILVVNAGSSSMKLNLLDEQDAIEEQTELTVNADNSHGVDATELTEVLRAWRPPDVVGHRIVHGGGEFTAAVRIDPEVERRLRTLTDLAPLHQTQSLAALDAVTALLPDVAAVACFDTAFHSSIPPEASTYALPEQWRDGYGVRRYGFHGLSHAYCARRAAELVDRPLDELRIVTCHLGAGASLAAVRNGRSVDTTMGFTPLEGLVMATRSGSVDPGVVLWLQEQQRLTPQQISAALQHHSGLLGLAGSTDLREIESAAERDADSRLAIDVYLHRLVAGIATMTAAMDGLDVLAFTGGVGENSAMVRRRAAERLDFLGVGIDPVENAAGPDRDLTVAGRPVSTVVLAAREDLQIAGEVRQLMSRSDGQT